MLLTKQTEYLNLFKQVCSKNYYFKLSLLKGFFNLVEEITNYLDTPQSYIEDIIRKSNLALSELPTFFTTEEENYIKEAMRNAL